MTLRETAAKLGMKQADLEHCLRRLGWVVAIARIPGLVPSRFELRCAHAAIAAGYVQPALEEVQSRAGPMMLEQGVTITDRGLTAFRTIRS